MPPSRTVGDSVVEDGLRWTCVEVTRADREESCEACAAGRCVQRRLSCPEAEADMVLHDWVQ